MPIPSTIPHIVTWYLIDKNTGRERELKGRTDDYTFNLYRAKGFVLDRKYLDPQLWNELEYGVKFPGGYANEDRKSLIAVAPQVRYLVRLRELSMKAGDLNDLLVRADRLLRSLYGFEGCIWGNIGCEKASPTGYLPARGEWYGT